MRKLTFLSFLFVILASSCTRFSRDDGPTPSPANTSGSDSRTEEVDYSKYNARFSFVNNSLSNSSIAARRSLANFFFYNEERIIAASTTRKDAVRLKDVDSIANEKFVWCDFKSESAWRSLRYEWSFYSFATDIFEYECKDMCDDDFSRGDERSCKSICRDSDVCNSYGCDSKKLMQKLSAAGLITQPFNKSVKGRSFLEKFQKNALWMIEHNSLISNTQIKNLEDTNKCYNAEEKDNTTKIGINSSYWNFKDIYEANGQDDAKFLVAAPKEIKSIDKIALEFGFNIDANREIIEDNGSYLKLDFKVEGTEGTDYTNQDFSATFVYSRDNLVVSDCSTPPTEATDCKELSVNFSDSCGELVLNANLVTYADRTEVQDPSIRYRNHRTAYKDPQCHYAGQQVMSFGNLPSIRPRNVIESRDGWVQLYESTSIIMTEIK